MREEAIFKTLPNLDTPRLLLRQLRGSDINDVFAYASDPLVAEHTTWRAHKARSDSERFVQSILNLYRTQQVAPWAVVHKADQKVIGTCGFGSWQIYHARAEIGYALARPYWGQGLTTEAVTAVINFGFRKMELNRIYAFCLPENIASARVLQKAGMAYEGLLRQYALIKGAHRDLELYAILRSDSRSIHT